MSVVLDRDYHLSSGAVTSPNPEQGAAASLKSKGEEICEGFWTADQSRGGPDSEHVTS